MTAKWLALCASRPTTRCAIARMSPGLLRLSGALTCGTCTQALKQRSLIGVFGLRLRRRKHADAQPLVWEPVDGAHHQQQVLRGQLLLILLPEAGLPPFAAVLPAKSAVQRPHLPVHQLDAPRRRLSRELAVVVEIERHLFKDLHVLARGLVVVKQTLLPLPTCQLVQLVLRPIRVFGRLDFQRQNARWLQQGQRQASPNARRQR